MKSIDMVSVAVMAMVVASAASAQNVSVDGAGARASLTAVELREYCVFNNKIFSQGVEICVRKGVAYRCIPPGTPTSVGPGLGAPALSTPNTANPTTIATWQPVNSSCAGGSEFPPP